MADSWEKERRKVWGLILDLKRKVKELEANNSGKKFEGEHTEEPPSAAGA